MEKNPNCPKCQSEKVIETGEPDYGPDIIKRKYRCKCGHVFEVEHNRERVGRIGN